MHVSTETCMVKPHKHETKQSSMTQQMLHDVISQSKYPETVMNDFWKL